MKLESIDLVDKSSGATAKILPGMGFNCYSFTVSPTGSPLEVLWCNPAFTAGTARPASSGIPILFPFAGRIRGTSYKHQGREYQLEIGDQLGNAIHGFVYKRPWRVLEHQGPRAVGQFQASVDDPSLLARWPADFRITASYELRGQTLWSEIVIENPDDHPLPYGLGTHGYFSVPLGKKGNAAECVVTAPVSTSWELENLLPTGRELISEFGPKLAAGMVIGETKLDHVFGGLSYDRGICTCRVTDPANGRRTTLTFSDVFRNCVIFNPPHREAICIEPYTTVPDAFWLNEQGIESGLRSLGPGEAFRTEINVQVE